MTDKRAIVVHDPTTHPMESYWAKREGAMTDSRGLREALLKVSTGLARISAYAGEPASVEIANEALETIDAALAANPAPAGLDVERLRQALDNEWMERAGDTSWIEDDADPFAKRAPRIAAEYARLGSAAEEEGSVGSMSRFVSEGVTEADE
jgi:hypothetical protein